MKIIIIAFTFVKRILKNKFFASLYIILPAFAVILSIFLFGSQSQKLKVGFVDQDKNSTIGHDLKQYMEDEYRIQTINIKSSDINEELISSNLDAVIVIPYGFENKIIFGKKEKIDIVCMKEGEGVTFLKEALKSYLVNIYILGSVANKDKSLFDIVFEKYKSKRTNLKVHSLEDESYGKKINSGTIGFMIFILLMLSSSSLFSIIMDRKSNLYERLIGTSLKEKDYIIGYIIGDMVIIILQIAMALIFMKLLKIDLSIPVYFFVFTLMLAGILSICHGIACISICADEMQLTLLNILFTMPGCMISGCLWNIEVMPKSVQTISFIFPQRWIMDMAYKLRNGANPKSIIINIFIVLLYSIFLCTLGINNLKKRLV